MITSQQNFNAASSEKTQSVLSWSAIFSGATAATALSLILLMLGVGLGFAGMSPWASQGASASTIGAASIGWLAFTQLAASGMGGYLAGRSRIKWITVHTDEVYFRDTVHGLLAWAVATLTTAALLTSAIGIVLGGGAAVANSASSATSGSEVAASVTSVANGGNVGNAESGTSTYLIDSLFRTDLATDDASTASENYSIGNLEANRIFANGLRSKELPIEDRQYLARKIAARTSISQLEAEKRVAVTFEKARLELVATEMKAKQIIDAGRRAAKFSALWMFITLLSSAFVASLAATYGGRQRDHVVHCDPTIV